MYFQRYMMLCLIRGFLKPNREISYIKNLIQQCYNHSYYLQASIQLQYEKWTQQKFKYMYVSDTFIYSDELLVLPQAVIIQMFESSLEFQKRGIHQQKPEKRTSKEDNSGIWSEYIIYFEKIPNELYLNFSPPLQISTSVIKEFVDNIC